MAIETGSTVRVLPPFDNAFPGKYTVELITEAGDGQAIVYLSGIDSAFSPDHLELIA